MKSVCRTLLKSTLLFLLIVFASGQLAAQNDPAYDKAIQEIRETFGLVPGFFEVVPAHALPSAWENFKQMGSPACKIPPKYRELLQLAVAAQIPCQYCIYFHTAAARANGATDEEIQEAIAQGAQTRHWSMILQGNQIDFDEFKKELDTAMKYMAENTKP